MSLQSPTLTSTVWTFQSNVRVLIHPKKTTRDPRAVRHTPRREGVQTIISTNPSMYGRSTIEVEPASAAVFSSLERLTEHQRSVALRFTERGAAGSLPE